MRVRCIRAKLLQQCTAHTQVAGEGALGCAGGLLPTDISTFVVLLPVLLNGFQDDDR
jgi:hypothetical protein